MANQSLSLLKDLIVQMNCLQFISPFWKKNSEEKNTTIFSVNFFIKDLFFKLEKSGKLDRFITLFWVLKIASKANYKSLSSFIYDKKYSINEGNRMRDVFEYTMNNYQKDISLETIANVANMTKNAFCKYFKKRTNKTFIHF